jgi:hypothetical protein
VASVLAVLALAGAGFALGAALSPDHADTGTTGSVTAAAARPVINAPDSAGQPPALARVKHHHAAKKAKPKATTTTPQSSEPSTGVDGTAAQQTPVQPSGGGSGTGTSTSTTQATKKKTTETSKVEPPPFDEHTTSGQ